MTRKHDIGQTRKKPILEEELAVYRASLKRKLHSGIYGIFRQLKEVDGLTQKELAARLGIDPALVSKRLRGDANVTLDTISDLARAMEASIEISVTSWVEKAKARTAQKTEINEPQHLTD